MKGHFLLDHGVDIHVGRDIVYDFAVCNRTASIDLWHTADTHGEFKIWSQISSNLFKIDTNTCICEAKIFNATNIFRHGNYDMGLVRLGTSAGPTLSAWAY